MPKAQPEVEIATCACGCGKTFRKSHARRIYAVPGVCKHKARARKLRAAAKAAGVPVHLSLQTAEALGTTRNGRSDPYGRTPVQRRARPKRVRPTLTPAEAQALVAGRSSKTRAAAVDKIAAALARVEHETTQEASP